MEIADTGVLLDRGRKQFAAYYRAASRSDAALFDTLLIAREVLLGNLATPREGLAESLRREVEKTADANERVFTALRERVRASASFAALNTVEQLIIERFVFDVWA
jgi:hypothetical protein